MPKGAEPVILPQGWIEKDEGVGKKVYYNEETEQTFYTKNDFDRYIKYYTANATRLHETEPIWTGRNSEVEIPNGRNYVPKKLPKKFQSSTSKAISRITHEDIEDEDEDDDQEYTPRKKYKRSSCKRKGKNMMKQTEDEENDDDHPMAAAPKRRQSKLPLSNRNNRRNSSVKGN